MTAVETRPRRRTLADGSSVTIRPLEAGDAFRLRRMFDRLSPESVYQRFFAPIPLARRAALIHLAGVDHDLHESLVAEAGGEIVAVARYDATAGARDDGGSADRRRRSPRLARATARRWDRRSGGARRGRWQGRGLGTLLLFRLAPASAPTAASSPSAPSCSARTAVRCASSAASPPTPTCASTAAEYVAYAPFAFLERNPGRSATR